MYKSVLLLFLFYGLRCQSKMYIVLEGVILEGDVGEIIYKNWSAFPPFQAQGEVVLHRIYRKNITKDYYFSSKYRKQSKLLPVFQICTITPVYWYFVSKCKSRRYYVENDTYFVYREQVRCGLRYLWDGPVWRHTV